MGWFARHAKYANAAVKVASSPNRMTLNTALINDPINFIISVAYFFGKLFCLQPRASPRTAREIQVIHGTESPMFVLHIAGSQVHISLSHLERRVPEDLLQAEYISAVDQIPYTESVPAQMWMQSGDAGCLSDALEYLLNHGGRNQIPLGAQIHIVFDLGTLLVWPLVREIIDHRFFGL